MRNCGSYIIKLVLELKTRTESILARGNIKKMLKEHLKMSKKQDNLFQLNKHFKILHTLHKTNNVNVDVAKDYIL